MYSHIHTVKTKQLFVYVNTHILYIAYWLNTTRMTLLKIRISESFKNTKLAVNYYNNKNYSNITCYDVRTVVWAMLIDGKEDLFSPESNFSFLNDVKIR